MRRQPETKWRTPRWAVEKFYRLVDEISNFEEDSDIAAAIRDEIQSLPNYPREAADRGDFIRPVNITVR